MLLQENPLSFREDEVSGLRRMVGLRCLIVNDDSPYRFTLESRWLAARVFVLDKCSLNNRCSQQVVEPAKPGISQSGTCGGRVPQKSLPSSKGQRYEVSFTNYNQRQKVHSKPIVRPGRLPSRSLSVSTLRGPPSVPLVVFSVASYVCSCLF